MTVLLRIHHGIVRQSHARQIGIHAAARAPVSAAPVGRREGLAHLLEPGMRVNHLVGRNAFLRAG